MIRSVPSTVSRIAQADFNGDGVVDWSDAIILLDRFGTAYTDPSCSEI